MNILGFEIFMSKIFSVSNKNIYWTADIFNTNVTEITRLITKQVNRPINISYDSVLQTNFKQSSLSFYLLSSRYDYTKILEAITLPLILSSTTYRTKNSTGKTKSIFYLCVCTKNNYINQHYN